MKGAWLGRLLRGVRAGEAKLAWRGPALATVPETLAVSSPAFAPGMPMPLRYAGAGVGDNRSPPLSWTGAPDGAAELVLIVEDPDVPLPRPFVHLLAYGVAPDRRGFDEGALAPGRPGVLFGRNTGGSAGYAGPRALPGHGPHGYHFELIALSRPSGLAPGASLAEALAAIAPCAVAKGRLVGTFEQGG